MPIGGGGLISGVSMAVKRAQPDVGSSASSRADGPAMQRSVDAGELVTLDCDTIIDGLRVKRVGEHTFELVQRFVDEIVTLPDATSSTRAVDDGRARSSCVEGAAAAPVAALLAGLVKLPAGTRVVCVISGGNLDLDHYAGAR